MFKRLLENQIKQKLFNGKVIIIVGARQTGKTTLALEILNGVAVQNARKIFNCDNPGDREMLANKNIEFLDRLIGKATVILIDEGQKTENVGQTLKLMVDYYKNKKQIIVTGSSSFNLLDKTQEPLTGRKYVYTLFPLSLEELYPNKDMLAILKELEMLLIYGSYPEAANQKSFEDKKEILKELASSYLYKDILEFQQIKSSTIITNLLKALALQIGSEVSFNELSGFLGIDKKTVERYINILEKNYIIFRLSPYSRNKRKEISKLKKIYFYDLGIRNAIINNFNFLTDRDDVGALWENFVIAERLKYQSYHKIYASNYFWKTYGGSEIDLIEERDGKLYGYEFKWKIKTRGVKPPAQWQEYKKTSYAIISPDNIFNFVI